MKKWLHNLGVFRIGVSVGLLTVSALAIVILLGAFWPGPQAEERHRSNFSAIQAMAKRGDLEEALQASVYAYPATPLGELSDEWASFEIDLAGKLRQLNRLAYWAEFREDLLKEEETACLNWVRMLIHDRKMEQARVEIRRWLETSANPSLWRLVQADSFLLAGKIGKADSILKAHPMEGTEEVFRLLRLAMIHARDTEAVDTYLVRALSEEPTNPDLRAYLGEIMEKRGRLSEAEREFLVAHRLQPENPVWQNLLVDFYIRRQQFHLAVRFMDTIAAQGLSEELWIKNAFLQSIVTGGSGKPETTGSLQEPTTELLRNLGTGSFWAHPAETGSWTAAHFRRPESSWLGLLEYLAHGMDEEAASHLVRHEEALRRFSWIGCEAIRAYLYIRQPDRQVGTQSWQHSPLPRHSSLHPCFQALQTALNDLSSQEADFFRSSPDAPSAIFLALGWLEAGLILSSGPSGKSPGWYTYSKAQALRYNRSVEHAVDFLQRHSLDRSSRCLLGELLAGQGETELASDIFESLQGSGDGAAYRAAWLDSTLAMERGDSLRVQSIIEDYAVLQGTQYLDVLENFLAQAP